MPDARFLLLGDSHALAIRSAAISAAIPVAGGAIDSGRNLNIGFHQRSGHDLVFNDPNVDAVYRGYLSSLEIDRIGDLTIPLLSTIGMNLHYLSRVELWEGVTLLDRPGARFLSRSALTETVRAQLSGALAFYADLSSLGVRTISVLPPRRIPNTPTSWRAEFFLAIEDIAKDMVEQAGATVIDHRPRSLDAEGGLKAVFRHPDPEDQVHGSEAFGWLVLCEMFERMNAMPRSGVRPVAGR